MLRTEEYVCELLRLEKPLRAFLHRFAPQEADLEDLLHETYAHLFALSPERRDSVRNVQAFAITSARNIAMDWIRRRHIVPIDSLEDLHALPLTGDESGLDEIVHTHQQLVRLADGVAQLPDRCREVFTLRRVYGLSQKEIAKKLGISDGAVEQLLVRGMRRCAEIMQSEPPRAPARAGGERGRWLGRWRRKLEL